MQINIGPVVFAIFGGIIVAVTTSPIWLQYVAPTLNAWLIGIAMGIVPLSFPLIHGAFNRYRKVWVKSAQKESGQYPLDVQERPISQQTVTPQPKTTSKAPAPQSESTPQTQPQPQVKQEESET